MTLSLMTAVGLRASLLLALTLCLLHSVRRASAQLRRCMLVLGFASSLALPLLLLPFPGRPVVHVVTSTVTARVFAEALSTEPVVVAHREPRAFEASAAKSRASIGSWLIAVWGLGVALLLARMLWGAVWAGRLVRRAEPEADGVRISAEIAAPVVIGAFSPTILLPRASELWCAERLRSVMLHEAAHVRRRDGLALLLGHAACALYWFQPLAWLALARLRRECELAADEDVIGAGIRPSTYADHLLAVAREIKLPALAISMARPSELARRIQALLSREQLPTPLSSARARLLGAGALLLLGFAACTDAVSKPAVAGASALKSRSAVDVKLQSICDEEASRVHAEWGAERVSIVVLDPHSGTVLATSDDAPGMPVMAASTLKPLVVAMALDDELITPDQRFDCGNGTRAYGAEVLRDAAQYGQLNAGEILAVSSNIGASRIFDVLGGDRLGLGLRQFHVDAPADIRSNSLRGAVLSIGQGWTTTPQALTAAYGVLANDGIYVSSTTARPERVIKESTARTLRSMLEGVVNNEHATGKGAQVTGVRIGGKTGTSDGEAPCPSCKEAPGLFASFVGIVPLDRPRWVIYVGVGEFKKDGSGGSIAAPAFARIAARALSSCPN